MKVYRLLSSYVDKDRETMDLFSLNSVKVWLFLFFPSDGQMPTRVHDNGAESQAAMHSSLLLATHFLLSSFLCPLVVYTRLYTRVPQQL